MASSTKRENCGICNPKEPKTTRMSQEIPLAQNDKEPVCADCQKLVDAIDDLAKHPCPVPPSTKVPAAETHKKGNIPKTTHQPNSSKDNGKQWYYFFMQKSVDGSKVKEGTTHNQNSYIIL